ncbi:MAG: GPP34 family phosphoprotein [Asgard group archaeon]|nr:GPP34 family phosphoprotein [Asgard group archaeon]
MIIVVHLSKLYTVDKLLMLRIGKYGIINQYGNYVKAIITAFLYDLVIEKRIALKIRDEHTVILKVIDDSYIGDPFLDEMFSYIRDCPKEYTVEHWIKRFTDSFTIVEESLISSLIKKEVLIKNPKNITIKLVFITIFGIILLPFIVIPILLLSQPHYGLRDNTFLEDLKTEFKENLSPTADTPADIRALISFVKAANMKPSWISNKEMQLVNLQYYRFYDFDFYDENLKVIISFFDPNINKASF